MRISQTWYKNNIDELFLVSATSELLKDLDSSSKLVEELQESLKKSSTNQLTVLVDMEEISKDDAIHSGTTSASNILLYKNHLEQEAKAAGILDALQVEYFDIPQKVLEQGSIPLNLVADLHQNDYDFSFLERWAEYDGQGDAPFECPIEYLIEGVDLSEQGINLQEMFSHLLPDVEMSPEVDTFELGDI